LSLAARIVVVIVRLKNDILPSFWANYGYNMGIKRVFNENSKMLKVPTPNSNLNLFTFTFHYINPTNAQQMHFSPVNKTVCLLECAALTSCVRLVGKRMYRTHRTVVPSRENHRKRPFTLILGKTRVQHGYQTGIQGELKDAQSSNSNSNLNLFTFTFHYINLTNTQQMRFHL
jgi:hypothetical protein